MNKSLLHYRLLKFVAIVSQWRHRNISDNAFFLILCTVVGIFCGFSAYILNRLILFITALVTGGKNPDSFHIVYLILPLVGIILASVFQRYVVKQDLSHGVAKITAALKQQKYNLKPSIMINSLIGCGLTIGFGCSAGGEGPVAYSGATVGSFIGRIFHLSQKHERMLLAIGGGAGIAAIFKAPVGGILFTLEVLQIEMSTFAVISLTLACVSAAATCLACSGFAPYIVFDHTIPFEPHLMFWAIILGLACGIYSIYYSRLQSKGAVFFTKIRNPWVKCCIAGISTSILVFLMPALYGEGFAVMSDLINGHDNMLMGDSPFMRFDSHAYVLPIIIGIILLCKSYLVAAANSGGGVAGDFAPTLYAGGLAGFLFAYIVNIIFPDLHLPSTHFALIGMSAVMAGTIHAPLMAIFITVEMSSSYGFFFPIVFAAILSYTVVKLLSPNSKYRNGHHDDLAAFAAKKLKSLL